MKDKKIIQNNNQEKKSNYNHQENKTIVHSEKDSGSIIDSRGTIDRVMRPIRNPGESDKD